MILIADSGSTKTHWCLVENKTIIKEIFTTGINPFYQTEEEIAAEIHNSVLPEMGGDISHIYFYGAGCNFPIKKQMVANAIHAAYPDAKIEVNNDLLAAARALCGKQAGIACILGTGSNSCFYNGTEIEQNISPLGFILGDEGSGAILGKLFISDLLKNQIPEDLKIKFFEETKITVEEIMENVYKKPFPNRYLAQFTRFISNKIDDSEHLQQLVYNSFVSFFERNVQQYDYHNYKVSFIGSIAVCFEKQLRKAALNNNIQLDKIIQNPIQRLIIYHQA